MIQVGFLLLLYIVAVTYIPGSYGAACNEIVAPAKDFNATSFAGTYYEVRQFFATPGFEGTCTATKITPNSDGSLNVVLGRVDTKNTKQKTNGVLKKLLPTEAKFSLEFPGKLPQLYVFFDIEYGKYFGAYSCMENKANVWVYSKKKKVADTELKDNIFKTMGANYLDAGLFSTTVQETCPVVL